MRCSLALLMSFAPPLAGDPLLFLDGDFVQGGMVLGRTTPSAEVRFDGEGVRVAADGRFVIGFGRDAPAQSVLTVALRGGKRQRRVVSVRQRTYETQRIDNLDESLVTPPPETFARIRREQALIAEVRRSALDHQDCFDEFQWPLKNVITGVYGSARILNGQPRSPHYGVDIAAPAGAVVRAPAGGIVTLVHDMYFSGVTLVLDHGYGVSSTFLHLSKALVAPGARVEQGTPIAEVGATGRTTGAHLDWRVNWLDQRLDPQLLAGPM